VELFHVRTGLQGPNLSGLLQQVIITVFLQLNVTLILTGKRKLTVTVVVTEKIHQLIIQ